MDTLQRSGYDLARAMCTLVPRGGPVLCRDEMEDWSASEAMLFEDALEKYGKDFTDIRQDFVSDPARYRVLLPVLSFSRQGSDWPNDTQVKVSDMGDFGPVVHSDRSVCWPIAGPHCNGIPPSYLFSVGRLANVDSYQYFSYQTAA